jgi:putative acetyltransferase
VIIRLENPADVAEIHAVTLEAFKGHPYSDGTEHLIVDRLRDAGALSLSLVAEVEGEVVGHIAFSPVELSDGSQQWFGLGPVSVLPSFQGQGIGGALIRKGLDYAEREGLGRMCGDGRSGALSEVRLSAMIPSLTYADCAPQYFLAQPLSLSGASGIVTYHPAFYAGVDE